MSISASVAAEGWPLGALTISPLTLAARQHSQVAQEALKKPQLIAQYQRMGAEPVGSSPQEFAAYMKSEEKKWAEIVRLSGAKAD